MSPFVINLQALISQNNYKQTPNNPEEQGSSSENRASFDWQLAPTVRPEAPTVRHKKARAGRARDALTFNASII